jgi:hypothetical protein
MALQGYLATILWAEAKQANKLPVPDGFAEATRKPKESGNGSQAQLLIELYFGMVL